MTTATISITGNLVKDAALEFGSGGAPRLSFTVAHTPSRRLPDGTYEDTGETQWYRCTLWGRPAEAWAPVLVKGQVGPVTVTGRFVPSIFDSNSGPRLSLDGNVDSVGVREPRSPRGGVSTGQRDTQQAPGGGSAGDPWATGGAGYANDEPPF